MQPIKPLVHTDAGSKNEDTLRREMHDFFSKTPALKFQAELLDKMFELIKSSPGDDPLSWWSYERMRQIFPVGARLQALEQRPELRQRVVCELTGIRPKTALKTYGTVAKQTEVIDAVLDDGDTELAQLEEAFQPEVWAVYIFNQTFWLEVRKALNNVIAESGPREKAFIAHIIERALANGLITHLDIRSTLDPGNWQRRIPPDKRVAVDRARIKYEHEAPDKPFTSRMEMEIVGFQTLAESFDSSDFSPVIDAIGLAMGFHIEGVIVEEADPKA